MNDIISKLVKMIIFLSVILVLKPKCWVDNININLDWHERNMIYNLYKVLDLLAVLCICLK